MEHVSVYMKDAVAKGIADIFFIAGKCISGKYGDRLFQLSDSILKPDDSLQLISQLYEMAKRRPPKSLEDWDDDFSVTLVDSARFRVNIYRQRGSPAAVLRIIKFGIPNYEKLGIPSQIVELYKVKRGMILITGPAGSGKSTTIACILDMINRNREAHIVTIEDPIEYLYRNNKSVFSQREVNIDTITYSKALRACLRQAPDVIMLGELRDLDTIQTAITAAGTGHLVISTLHSLGSVNTMDRLIDVFPEGQQQQVRVQLAQTLNTVISQQLLPTIRGFRVPAFEIMHLNPAIKGYIRDSRPHQIEAMMAQCSKDGMILMDDYIRKLYNDKIISRDTALECAIHPTELAKRIGT